MINEAGQAYGFRYQPSNGSAGYYWYQFNLQGDVIGLIDGAGNVVARYSYDAWGKPYVVTNGSGAANSSSTFIGNINPLRYRGYYYDVENEFVYVTPL